MRLSHFHSLRWRIYGGFAVIILVFMFNAILVVMGQESTRRRFDHFRRVDIAGNAMLRIDRNVQRLKRRVDNYVFSGDNTHRDEFLVASQKLKKEIRAVLPNAGDLVKRQLLVTMSEHLDEYSHQFQQVIEERELRAELVQIALPKTGRQVHSRLQVISSAIEGLDTQRAGELRLAVLSAQRYFSAAQATSLRYFMTPDSALLTQTLAELDASHGAVESMRLPMELAAGDLLREAVAAFQEYEKTYLRAVQATRGYLYLVNVVMAGEAAEFAYHSEKLQTLAHAESQRIGQETTAAVVGTKQLSVAVATVALLCAVFISLTLAYHIVSPITRMTKTFRRLADGETAVAIPGTDRRDEIGEMALAADVFQDRNRQTLKLLDQAHSLSNELVEKAKELELINEELDSFAYVASHDLKSPLRGIQQLASWVREDCLQLIPPASQLHLHKLQHRVQKMESMLQDLLDYSRIGRTRESSEVVEIATLLSNVIELLDNPHDIQLQIPKQQIVCRTSPTPLKQVFLNLLTNAIKHHHNPAEGFIEIQAREFDDYLEFSVRDNGPGIATQQHQRIFQLYQRVGDPNVDGSGMGLAILKKQIEKRGGRIWVDSQLGQGATFSFTWRKEAETSAVNEPAEVVPPATTGSAAESWNTHEEAARRRLTPQLATQPQHHDLVSNES